MPKGRTPFGRRADRTGSVEVFVRPERSMFVRLLAGLWQLRAELTALAVGVYVWLWLTDRMPRWAGLAVVLGTVAALLLWGPTRRLVVGHVWCTVTRHRLRSCMAQTGVTNRHGYVPWLLWVRPTNVGERVRLLMRPGICADDLEGRTAYIAAACWARDARVRPNRRVAALVTVDVIRHNPLTADRTIGSPLPVLSGRGRPDVEPGGADELAMAGESAPHVPTLRAVRGGRAAEPEREVPAAPGLGPLSSSGEDVSDYV
jgi:hypothetical protein